MHLNLLWQLLYSQLSEPAESGEHSPVQYRFFLPCIPPIFTVHCIRGTEVLSMMPNTLAIPFLYLGTDAEASKFRSTDLRTASPQLSHSQPITSFTPHSQRCNHVLLLLTLYLILLLNSFLLHHSLHHSAVLSSQLYLSLP